ncbi:MAG: RIP metalloprotease RseP [Candidatus Zixiibacteriota bacterium]
MLLTIASFVFVLGVLIFIHELGHFLVAKKVGITVDKFSLGFPPYIFSKKVGETTYCIGIIPLGGFVKMAGENPDEETTGAPGEFMSKTVGQRAAVVFAGPFMNYLLAIIFMIGVIYFTGQPIFDENQVEVKQVNDNSPANTAGIKEGDIIVAIDEQPIHRYDSLSSLIHSKVEVPIGLTLVRGADTININLTTMKAPIPNADGGADTVGLIGVMLSQKITGYKSYGLGEAVSKGFVTTHIIVWETMKFIKKVVTGQVSSKMIGGPLFIAQQSGKEVRKGASSLFFFMALLSVNLAVLNVLPIPVLDGGHLVFLGLEKIKGSPLSIKARMAAQQVGIILLLGLILIVTYNDILRVFRGF